MDKVRLGLGLGALARPGSELGLGSGLGLGFPLPILRCPNPNPNPNLNPNPSPSPSPSPNLGQAGQRVVRVRVGWAADKRRAEAEVVGVDGLVDRAVLDARLREDHLLASVDQVVWIYREGRGGLTVMTVRVRE